MENEEENGIEIPYGSLSTEALEGVIKDFILREGTDYGSVESSYEDKVSKVLGFLEKGKAKVFFDQTSETCTIILSY